MLKVLNRILVVMICILYHLRGRTLSGTTLMEIDRWFSAAEEKGSKQDGR